MDDDIKKTLYFYYILSSAGEQTTLSHGHHENQAMRITRQTIKSREHKLQISNNPKNIKKSISVLSIRDDCWQQIEFLNSL